MSALATVAAQGDVAASGPAPDVPALGLVARLCATLAEQRIDYCHFKSTQALARSATGDNDLDLLVSRSDSSGFAEIVHRLGFKQARVKAHRDVPGVLHYYAPDPLTGRLVDLHVHYQLIVGDDMTKNHRLPIERAYLASARQGLLFRVPAPEFELALLVIRLVLKHAPWDAKLTFQGEATRSERAELDFLREQTNAGEVWAVVRDHMPFVGRTLWDRCTRCAAGETHGLTSIRVAHDLDRALAAHTRSPAAVDVPRRIVRRAGLFARRRVLRRPRERMRLESGGAVVAFVGGDGAGKSTAVDATAEWLGAVFETTTVHLGRPARSLTTLIAELAWGLTSGVRSHRTSGSAELARVDGGIVSLRGQVGLLRELMTSRDRYRAYARARRAAGKGAIVVCDRYPLPQISLMDGPVSARLALSGARSAMVRRLVDVERRYYAHVLEPDVLLVLRVDPDLAVERKIGEERPEFVRPRVQEVWTADWSGSRAVVIDANRSADEVFAEVRSAIWSHL